MKTKILFIIIIIIVTFSVLVFFKWGRFPYAADTSATVKPEAEHVQTQTRDAPPRAADRVLNQTKLGFRLRASASIQY